MAQFGKKTAINLKKITNTSATQDIDNNFRAIQTQLQQTQNYLEPMAVAGATTNKDWDSWFGYHAPVNQFSLESYAVSVTDYENDQAGVDERLTKDETTIAQNALDIQLRVTQDSYDSDQETLDNRISHAEADLTLNAANIELRVEKDGVISAINETEETIKIQASKIQLQGSVTILSDIADNLGDITAGSISGVTIISKKDANNFTSIQDGNLQVAGVFLSDWLKHNGYYELDLTDGVFTLEFGDFENSKRSPLGTFSTDGIGIKTLGPDGKQGIYINPSSESIGFGDYFDGAPVASLSTSADGFDIFSKTGITVTLFRGAFSVLNPNSVTGLGNIQANEVTADRLNSSGHVYLRPAPGDIVLAVQAGTTNQLVEMRAARFTTSSHKKFKDNITPWVDSVWDLIKNTKLYSYNLKSDIAQGIDFKHYGVVLGDGYGAPGMMVLPDGEHIDEHNSGELTFKGLQEALLRIEQLENRIAQLEE